MIRDTLKRLATRLRAPAAAANPPSAPRAPVAPPPPPEEPEGPEVEVEATAVRAWEDSGNNPLLLDIREVHELSQGHISGALLLPMNQVPGQLALLPRDRPLVVYCHAGVRSYSVAHYLREQGFEQAWSLIGGVGSWGEVGGTYVQPPWPAPRYTLTQPVRVREAVAQQRGMAARAGTVQEIQKVGEECRYAVAIPVSGGFLRIADLAEADLEPIGRA